MLARSISVSLPLQSASMARDQLRRGCAGHRRRRGRLRHHRAAARHATYHVTVTRRARTGLLTFRPARRVHLRRNRAHLARQRYQEEPPPSRGPPRWCRVLGPRRRRPHRRVPCSCPSADRPRQRRLSYRRTRADSRHARVSPQSAFSGGRELRISAPYQDRSSGGPP